jgi:hypothetical protein
LSQIDLEMAWQDQTDEAIPWVTTLDDETRAAIEAEKRKAILEMDDE